MTKINQKELAQIELYLQHGIDLHHRRIYFGDVEYDDGGDVSFSSIEMALRSIDKMLDLNNKPIEIHMSSYGGDVYHMTALYDKIQESPCKFIFYGRGAIMSAATWIMAGCDERFLSKNTTIMVHDGSYYAEERSTDNKITTEENDRLDKILADIYAENSYMDANFWIRVCQRDLYLTAEEAVKLGLADKVKEYRKRGNFRRGVRAHTFTEIPPRKEIAKVVEKLYKRIKVSVPRNLTIEVKKEECETIHSYDKSQEEMERMGLTKPEKEDNAEKSGSNGE